MNENYSPLSLLSATHADRTSVLMHYMIEDFAGLDGCLPRWQPKPGQSPLATSTSRAVGPALDDVTRRRLHGLASLLMMTRDEAERWYAEYWLVYTVMSAYARPLHTSGWGFLQMVARLDGLTQRASTLLPRLRVPGLECLEVTASSLVMRLREDRLRSARFLHGILRRLAADFGAEVTLSEPSEFGESAVRVEVTAGLPERPVRNATPSALSAPVRQMRPAVVLSAPPRHHAAALMAV